MQHLKAVLLLSAMMVCAGAGTDAAEASLIGKKVADFALLRINSGRNTHSRS